MQDPGHRYLVRDNLLLGVEGSLLRLCRILWARRSPFALREVSAHAWLRRVPVGLLLPLRVSRALLAVLRARSGKADVLEMPVRGDLAVRSRPDGYKYFDFRDRRVLVHVGSGVDRQNFGNYVGLLKRIGEAGVGPRIGSHQESSLCYEEQLVEGIRVRSIVEDWARLQAPVDEFLRRLFRVPGRRVVAFDTYREQLCRQWTGLRAGLFESSRSVQAFQGVDDCWNDYFARTTETGRQAVCLGLTHGDFRERNFTLVDGRIVAIDWLTIGERSGLYDLYSILFTALVYVPEHDERVRGLMHQRLDAMYSRLSRDLMKEPVRGMACTVVNEESFDFQLFVLEFLLTRLGYFVAPYGLDSEFGSRMMDQLLRYIAEFERYRRRSPDTPSKAHHSSGSILCAV